MTIIEFVEYMKKNTNRVMKEDQLLSMVKKQLDVKDYLSIKAKRALVDDIINECILYENGIYKFDCIDKYVYFTMYTIAAYTNLELSGDVESDFDILSQEKLLPIILGTIKSEYDDVNILLQMQCDSILENNSVELIVAKFLDSVMDFLNSMEGGLKHGIDKILNLKLPEGFDLNKLLDLLNKN